MPYDPALAERLIKIVARKRGVDPALAVAVAQQESGFNSEAVGDGGNSRGLFQLQAAAATDAGIDPAHRQDVLANIDGGVEYLRQSLDRASGDVSLGLNYYNKGPSLKGGDPQYVEHVARHLPDTSPVRQSLLVRAGAAIGQLVSPSSAEAAPANRAAMEQRLRAIEAIKAKRQADPALSPVSPERPTIDIVKGGDAPTAPVEPEAPMAAGALEFLPGFEFLALLPPDAQAKVIEAVPGLAKTAAATGINMVGTAGGAAAGALTSPLTGPAGPVVGASMGSYGARRLNQALGLEEGEPTLLPKDLGDAVALAAPVATAIPSMVRAGLRRLPGAAPVLHEEAATALQSVPGRLAPQTPSATLYAQAAQGNPPIPTAPILRQAQTLIAQEQGLQPSLRSTPLLRVAQDIQALASQPGGVPLNVLRDHQQRLGLLIQQASQENWPQLTGLRRLYGAFHDAYEQAAASGVPQAGVLREAVQTARREFAVEDLAELLQPGRGINTRVDGLVQVNGGRLLDTFQRKLMTDETFARSFTAAETNAIRDLLHAITRIPRIAPPRGVGFGAGAPLARGGLAGGVTQYLFGDPALTSLVSGIAAGAPYVLSHALMTDTGRALLRQTLQTHGALSAGDIALLSTVLRLPSLTAGQELAVEPGRLGAGQLSGTQSPAGAQP